MIWYVEENKRKYPTVIPFHGILLSGMLRKKLLESMNCSTAPMWRFLCVKQLKCSSVGVKNDDALGVGRDALGVGRDALGVGRDALGVTRYVLKCRKKSAWTDLDRVDFEKKSSMFKCSNRKIGVDRSREK